MSCLARLTNWNKNHWEICPRRVATLVKTCPNQAEPGTNLCERCSRREEGGRAQSMAIHGLLTDPIPEFSHIYGGPWFWKWVEKVNGDIPEDWILEAEKAQEEAETFCEKEGYKPWRLINGTQENSKEEMPKLKLKLKPLPKAEDLPKAAKLPFKPITKFYSETKDEPEKLETDTQKIWKEKHDGKEVWKCETGHIFEDNDGKPGKFIGKYIDDEFIGQSG